MRKIFAALLSCLLVFANSGICAFAKTDDEQVMDSYEVLKAFYQKQDTLIPDEIITVETLGLEAENFTYDPLYSEDTDFASLYESDIAKLIITLSLTGENPYDANGTDLVALLESYVHEDGSIYKEGGYPIDANYQVWCLYALEVVESPKVELAADGLAKMQITSDTTEDPSDRNNNKGGIGVWYVSIDTTGWCVEALSIANKEKYQDVLSLAVEYMLRKQESDSTFKPDDFVYGDDVYPGEANTDTQAVAIQGLSVYDREGVKEGSYDQENSSVFDLLFKNQSEEGCFVYTDFTYESYNQYATFDAGRGIGTYVNGSFVLKARSELQETLAKADQEIVESDKTDETKAPAAYDAEDLSNAMESPETADETSFGLWMILLFASCGVLVYVRKQERSLS